jgi:hypothetical protein
LPRCRSRRAARCRSPSRRPFRASAIVTRPAGAAPRTPRDPTGRL